MTLALLLHKRRMVSLASLDYVEMGRCLLAVARQRRGGLVARLGLRASPFTICPANWLLITRARSTRHSDRWLAVIWTLIAKWILEKTGSALPRVAMRRLRLG